MVQLQHLSTKGNLKDPSPSSSSTISVCAALSSLLRVSLSLTSPYLLIYFFISYSRAPLLTLPAAGLCDTSLLAMAESSTAAESTHTHELKAGPISEEAPQRTLLAGINILTLQSLSSGPQACENCEGQVTGEGLLQGQVHPEVLSRDRVKQFHFKVPFVETPQTFLCLGARLQPGGSESAGHIRVLLKEKASSTHPTSPAGPQGCATRVLSGVFILLVGLPLNLYAIMPQ